jgi:hypothetical protein
MALKLNLSQGNDYWWKIYEGLEPLTEDDILHLQKWVALSSQREIAALRSSVDPEAKGH